MHIPCIYIDFNIIYMAYTMHITCIYCVYTEDIPKLNAHITHRSRTRNIACATNCFLQTLG